jgi:hypothetical protein
MRPLSDPVPLRDTSVWPGYDAITILPRVYGRARIKPLRYNEAGTITVLADHPLAGVDSVTVDGDPVPGWKLRNGADMTGHAVAFLDLAEAPDTTAVLAAEVRGLDGNPAAIINDLYPRDDLQDFAVLCRNAGLVLGGALNQRMTIRAALQFVLEQVGCVWSAGMLGFAAPFPPPTDAPTWAAFGPLDLADWTAECGLDSVVTRLTVPFDWDYSSGKARQSVVLEAPTSTRDHGPREAERALPWVRDARQAVATATTGLQWRARPLWTLKFSADLRYRNVPPGGRITVTHPNLPYSGDYVVTDLDPGYGSGTVRGTAQAPAGLTPEVFLVQQSRGFGPIQTTYQIQVEGDTVTVIITDEHGDPLPGARVWVDGKGPIIANAAAQIHFRATPGRHVLHIEASGKAAIDTEITL